MHRAVVATSTVQMGGCTNPVVVICKGKWMCVYRTVAATFTVQMSGCTCTVQVSCTLQGSECTNTAKAMDTGKWMYVYCIGHLYTLGEWMSNYVL